MNHQDKTGINRTVGQLESHMATLNESMNELKISLNSIQRRLNTVERQHSFIRGTVAALLFLGTLFGAAMDHIIKWFMGR